MEDEVVQTITAAVERIDGLEALALGGSRARGAAGPWSDYDFGIYYRSGLPPSAGQLRAALERILDHPDEAVFVEAGEWGPWIDGGAWLRVSGRKVDLLLRDLNRIGAVVEECLSGTVTMHYQPGHPHGFCSAIWAGEVALCRPLIDKNGALAALKRQLLPYPDPLGLAIVRKFHWEVAFAIDNFEIAVPRADPNHLAGCAYRALACAAQVLFALNGRYLINEKGALQEAARLPLALEGAGRSDLIIWEAIGAQRFVRALDELRLLSSELDALVHRSGAAARILGVSSE